MSDQMLEQFDAALPDGGTPEPTADTPPDNAPQEDGDTRLWAGKYKSPEDMEHAHNELQSVLGRQGDELRQLREMTEQIGQHVTQPQAPPLTQETVDWLDEQVVQNPEGAAVWALQSDPSGVLYNRAMESWYEMNPRQAGAFERALERQQTTQEIIQQIAPTLAPLVERATQNDYQAAITNVTRRYTDFPQYGEQLLQEAQTSPWLGQALQQGTLADKERVLEQLYFQMRGRQGIASSEGQATSHAESQAAKLAATVGSPTMNVVETGKSAGDQWLDSIGFEQAARDLGLMK